MAFHPFRTFRKNQKTWLAALTILSMLSFVVLGSMSGTVDYFARAFGANKGKTMVYVHGQPIYYADLQGLRIRREAVNTFMTMAVDFAKRKAFAMVQSNAQDWKDPQAQQPMMQVYIAHLEATGGAGDQMGTTVEQKLAALNQGYTALLGLQFGAKARNNTKEAEDLDTLAQILISDYQDALRSKGETYFGGKLDTEGLADFMLLREQADRLGISLKDDGVEQLVREDTLNMLTPQDLQAVANRVRQNYGRSFRTEDWNAALRDEFRVRLAREALLGYNPSRPTPGFEMGLPLAFVGHQALTPYGLWQDYQQARAERRIGLLPIPVNNKKFISQVSAPKESELVAFFEKYKNKPRDPNVAEPGFMIPERYAIEWVGTRKDAPYFVNKAEGQLRAKVAAVVAASNLGLTPALADADLVNWFSKLDSLTQDLKFNRLWDDGSYFEKIRSRGETTSAVDTAAAVAAALGNATSSSAPALVGASALQCSLAGTELQNAMLPAFDATLMGLAGTPGMGWIPATTWLKYTDINKRYLPEAVAQARTYEELRGEVASKLVNDTLQDLQTELQSRSSLVNASAGAEFQRLYEPAAGHVPAVVRLLSAQLGATAPAGAVTAAVLAAPAAQQYPATVEARSRLASQMLAAGTNPFTLLAVTAHELSPAAALMRQPIDQAVRTYGLDHAAMRAPVDRFDLAKAKALTRLKDAVESASPENQSAESRDTQFMNTLVGNPDQAPQGSLYDPKRSSGPEGEEFLYWNTGFVDRRVPSFAEVRAHVKERWVFDKARSFAEAEAKRLAAEVARDKGPAADGRQNLLRVAGSQPLITLDAVAKLSKSRFPPAMASSAPPYRPYEVPADTGVKPSRNFVSQLLTLKGLGDATVVHDASESTYYVAVLEKEDLPSREQFNTDYASPGAHGQLVSIVDAQTETEHPSVQTLLEALRQQADLKITDDGRDAFRPGRQ